MPLEADDWEGVEEEEKPGAAALRRKRRERKRRLRASKREEGNRGRGRPRTVKGETVEAAVKKSAAKPRGVTKFDKLAVLESIIRDEKATASERRQAIMDHSRLAGELDPEDEKGLPDPVYVLEYLRRAAKALGLKPKQFGDDALVKHLEGLAGMRKGTMLEQYKQEQGEAANE
jgi:hypothetical protein